MSDFLITLAESTLTMSAVILLLLLLIIAAVVGGLTAAGGEREEHDGRQQEGGKGSELHDGGFLSCDEFDFFKNRGVLLFSGFRTPDADKKQSRKCFVKHLRLQLYCNPANRSSPWGG